MFFTGEWFSDNSIMCSVLEKLEYYSGTERREMVKVHPSVGGSMLYGLTWRGPYLSPTKQRTRDEETGLFKTKVYDMYPELKPIFREFANLHFPDHKWEQTQINKCFPCPPHKDGNNIGVSVLCCFGDFTGGLTAVETEDGLKKYDAREGPVKFDGGKLLHWVEPYVGTRYSLVFFSNRAVLKRINKIKNML
mgnify:CR=1 FL=1